MNRAKLNLYWRRHYTHIGWAGLIFATFLTSAFVWYLRFPNNYRSPNFYAEDGFIFTKNLLEHGLWRSLGITFNGYFVWGQYLLTDFGILINRLFYGSSFIQLPRSYALVSYGFLAGLAVLPMLLLRKYLSWPYLMLLAAFITMVPVPGSDYAIIGTLGNFKFAFVYIALLLTLYRLREKSNSRKLYVVDAFLLVCGYTNVTIYPLLLVLIVPYWKIIRVGWKRPLRLLQDNPGLVSLVVLGLLLIPQLIVVKVYGIPKLPGYLDSPFQVNRLAEVVLHRPYLYSVVYGYNKHFTDPRAVLGLIGFLISAGLLRGRRATLSIWLGIGTIALTTALFVLNRPGISSFFFGYQASGPDQFFFTQNIIFYLVCVLLLSNLAWRLSRRYLQIAAAIVVIIVVLGQYRQAGSYGANDFMHHDVGTIYADARKACTGADKTTIDLPIYPDKTQRFRAVPRKLACTRELANYQPDEVDLGITPYQNAYLGLGTADSTRVTQTFVSAQPQLSGIDLHLATFGASTLHTPYMLTLYQADCSTKLRQVRLPLARIRDNAFAPVEFAPVASSRNQTYCFTVRPTSEKLKTPLAIRFGAPGSYPAGETKVAGVPGESDVVFRLLYRERIR